MKKIQTILLLTFITLQSIAQIHTTEYCSGYEPSKYLVEDASRRLGTDVENITFNLTENTTYKKLDSKYKLIIEVENMYTKDVIIYSNEESWLLSIFAPEEDIYIKLYDEYCQKYEERLPSFSCHGNPSTIFYYENNLEKWHEITIYNSKEDNIIYFILDENLRVTRKGRYPADS